MRLTVPAIKAQRSELPSAAIDSSMHQPGAKVPETAPPGAVSRHIKGRTGSKFPGESSKESTPRTELGREDTHACAAADLIDLIRHVDDIEAHRQRTGAGEIKRMTHAEIELVIARSVIPVRDDVAVG